MTSGASLARAKSAAAGLLSVAGASFGVSPQGSGSSFDGLSTARAFGKACGERGSWRHLSKPAGAPSADLLLECTCGDATTLSLIHISEPTRPRLI
eukprot:288569-Amphidinium_carterae.1